MSCPDWQTLCRRHETERDETPEWRAALTHLDECRACQDAAPAFDPALLFRRLPALEVGHDDVEAMKQAVAGMRRGRTIERRVSPWTRYWRQAAALAAVLLGSVLLKGAGVEAPATGTTSAVSSQAAPRAAADIDLWRMPLVETADPTYGSIIQVVDDDISLVLVMPSETDV